MAGPALACKKSNIDQQLVAALPCPGRLAAPYQYEAWNLRRILQSKTITTAGLPGSAESLHWWPQCQATTDGTTTASKPGHLCCTLPHAMWTHWVAQLHTRPIARAAQSPTHNRPATTRVSAHQRASSI